jgi:signal transduction histidine kinase
MPSPVIQARLAPVALLIALAFVVVGFLRVDREMTQAERDRAALTASETATLVEVFLLRQVTRLQSIEHAAETLIPDSLALNRAQGSSEAVSIFNNGRFDGLWVVVPSSRGQTVTQLYGQPSKLTVDSTAIRQLVESHSSLGPKAVVTRQKGETLLWLVQSIGGRSHSSITGLVSLDSLTYLLHQQRYSGSVGITVTARSDTILFVPDSQPNNHRRSVERTVVTPFGEEWLVTTTYTPAGRGVRIALWVVGLGAIVGLGIGLLLERREASRIADRSSELEHLSTELLRANRAKSEFLANVSHELRTPLNAIVGFVDLLRDGVYGPLNSRQTGPVERIEASANHLRHLVDQVLDLAKMAAGRLEVHTEPVELRPFVFDVASEVEPLMTEKGLSFSLAIGATLPRVRTDPTHLRQILINLLGNAVKFTNDGGIAIRGKLIKRNHHNENPEVLTAAASSETLWIALQVADSGVGIAEKDRERIFDEFEQVNAGPRGDSMRRGTGLGLSISRRLARLLGGDISVESELGRGSVFTVWLPIDPADIRGDQAA